MKDVFRIVVLGKATCPQYRGEGCGWSSSRHDSEKTERSSLF